MWTRPEQVRLLLLHSEGGVGPFFVLRAFLHEDCFEWPPRPLRIRGIALIKGPRALQSASSLVLSFGLANSLIREVLSVPPFFLCRIFLRLAHIVAGQWQSRDFHPGGLAPELALLTTGREWFFQKNTHLLRCVYLHSDPGVHRHLQL